MKRICSLVVLLLFFAIASRAEDNLSVEFFYESLAPYGDWVELDHYGYCWQPREVDWDWRPYSDGRWIYTDAGWTWDSEAPYSWAVYHYGRWARVHPIGWVWVPGGEWGPAWVAWRRSSRHVGWAPLPPEAEFLRASGFDGHVDAQYDIGPGNYNFVDVRNFGASRLRNYLRPQHENLTIIQQTINITRVTYVHDVVYNAGPSYEATSRQSAAPIRRLKLDRRKRLEGGGLEGGRPGPGQLSSQVEGNSLRVVAVPFETRTKAVPKKLGPKTAAIEIDHGWKNAGPPAEVAKVRHKIKGESAGTRAVVPPIGTTKPERDPAARSRSEVQRKPMDSQRSAPLRPPPQKPPTHSGRLVKPEPLPSNKTEAIPLPLKKKNDGRPQPEPAQIPDLAREHVRQPIAPVPEAKSNRPPLSAAPKAAAPKAVAPKAVAPKAVAPKAVAPKAVAPKAVAPKAVAPKAVAPKAVAPKAVAPKAVARSLGDRQARPRPVKPVEGPDTTQVKRKPKAPQPPMRSESKPAPPVKPTQGVPASDRKAKDKEEKKIGH